MKLTTFHKVPVEIEISKEDAENILTETLYETYWDNLSGLTEEERKAFARVYRYFSGYSIAHSERYL